jgi:16S rRNA (guanine966-N2)-methyltransferase
VAARAKSAGKKPPHTGSLRIIGGTWRSRRLNFPEREGLRPTPDRVRETLFNWLQPWLPGANCLDLFAGSGALGFEALSRGAGRAVLVERDPQASDALRANIALLKAQHAEVVQTDAPAFLRGAAQAFDIVFLDPPYRSDLLAGCCAQLEAGGWLRPGALIYMEAQGEQDPPLPAGWTLLRSKRAGQVGYHLARRTGGEQT